MATLIDGYSETNRDSLGTMYNLSFFSQVGQSFQTSSSIVLDSAVFQSDKVGSPTGNVTASIYAHSGTYGTSSVPTGAALAVSDPVDASTVTIGASLKTFTFSGANRITLSANTKYCVLFWHAGGDSSNHISFGFDLTSPTHSGNHFYSSNNSTYSALSGRDLCFYVYGENPPAATGTSGYAALMGVG